LRLPAHFRYKEFKKLRLPAHFRYNDFKKKMRLPAHFRYNELKKCAFLRTLDTMNSKKNAPAGAL
jgi:hypothetical protein